MMIMPLASSRLQDLWPPFGRRSCRYWVCPYRRSEASRPGARPATAADRSIRPACADCESNGRLTAGRRSVHLQQPGQRDHPNVALAISAAGVSSAFLPRARGGDRSPPSEISCGHRSRSRHPVARAQCLAHSCQIDFLKASGLVCGGRLLIAHSHAATKISNR